MRKKHRSNEMLAQQDSRHLSLTEQEIIRKKAVDSVLSGMKQVEVARVYGVSEWSVSQWMQQYRKSGKKGLTNHKRGTRSPNRLLEPRQTSAIRRIIEKKHPEQEGLPFSLWTREAVQKLIWKKYQIRPALRTLTDYLRNWGMTPQKPLAKAYEQNPKAIEQWLQEDYPKIKAKANQEKALIYWCDEMGLRSDHVSGRSYSPKGKTPVVIKSGKRFSCNMISAISNLGKLYFSVFEGSFVIPIYLDFLTRLIRQNKGRKVILIVDGHPVHRAKAVKEWLKEQINSIEVFYIPGYSPELNPDELLNQEIKATVFQKKHPRNKGELKALLKSKLYEIQKDPRKVESFFKAKLVLYAAA
jgi:transposase